MKVLIFSFLILLACAKKEKPYINGWLVKFTYSPTEIVYKREAYVYKPEGFKMIPIVLLNEQELELLGAQFTWYYYGNFFPFELGQKYELKIKNEAGLAKASLFMPSDFVITQPKSGYLITLDTSFLKIFWQKASRAEWYMLELYLEYWYEDTLGEDHYYEFSKDTILYDTSYVIPTKRFFLPSVKRIYEGEGCITVYAGCGASDKPGTPGNIKGAGFGFFSALVSPLDVEFFVGAPPKIRRKFPNPKERMVERLKKRR